MKKIYVSLMSLLVMSVGYGQVNQVKAKPIKPSLINTTPLSVNLDVSGKQTNASTVSNAGQNLAPISNNGNQNTSNQQHHCKSHELTKAYYESIGDWDTYQQGYLDAAAQMQNYVQNKTTGPSNVAIVFHVVHEGEPVGTGTNVSNADIMAMYNDLVEDFSLTNADQSNARTGAPFNFTPANPAINFCLATQDPNGLPLAETGVTRIQTTQTWFDSDNPSEVNAMKSAPLGQPIWDRNDYLNVWICDISNGASSGTAGYAYRPTTVLPNAAIDGIVVDYNLGVNNDNVLTHEVGHYLGLDHTWGGSGSCTSDDGFSDTPNTIGPSFNYGGSCSGSQQTCGTTEVQYENYMDYSNCTVMFTQEQANYMNSILSGLRASLANSNGCDPAGPPNCDFSSTPAGPGPVIIAENGTVIFTDESSAAPTGWTWTISGVQGTDWDYTGGTTANSQNPQVTFYNVGTYDVTLVASNGFGACSGYTENGYVQVVAPASGTACDTLRNYDPALPGGFYTYANSGTGWGSFPGHIDYDGTLWYSYAFAEELTATATSEVRRIILPVFTAYDGSGTGTVDFNVYADGGAQPGGILATETVPIADLNAGFYNTIDFTTPASVTGTFYVGYSLNYGSPQDTVLFGFADTDVAPAVDDCWMDWDGFGWGEYGFVGASLAMDVLMSNGPAPTFNYTISSTPVCPGGDVVVNSSSSTNATDYEWYLTDDTPVDTLYDTQLTSAATFTMNNWPADYQLWGYVEGSCMTAFDTIEFVVNPFVSGNVGVTHTTCGLNNGEIQVTGATGGDGVNYEYSLDNVNWQTSNTFSNLPEGNYDIYLQTTGANCNATANVTINASTPLSGTATAADVICPGGTANLTASGGTTYTWYDGSTVIGTGASISVSPTVQTQYSVEISDGTCTDVQYSNVTVDPLDDASFDFFDFCDGAPNSAVNIGEAGGTFSFVGASSGATINPTTGEISNETVGFTYTVEYNINNNCANSSQQTVTVNTQDDPAFTTGDFCEGSTNTVSGIGTPGGTFTYDGTDASSINASTGVITNGVAGTTYNITYTTPPGVCQSVSSPQAVTVNTTPTVGAGTDQTICSGNTVTLTATNPDVATISWDNGVTDGAAFTPSLGATTYTVTADLSGCTAQDQVTVTVDLTPSVDGGADVSVCDGDMVTLTATNPDAGTIGWTGGITDGVAFTPALGSTTYTVTSTLGACSSTDDVIVDVNIVPSVDAGMDTTICENESITLTAGNPDAATITWTNGVTDGVAFNPVSGVITYTATATLGACSSQDQVVITVNAAPTVTGVVTHDDGSTNGTISTNISGGSGSLTISWDNGATTDSLSNLAAGDYTITVTDSLGCETVETYTVLSTVGLESNLNEELLIFPNPTDGEVNIFLTGEYSLSILDARGRLVLTTSESDNSSIDLSKFESGVYFVQVQKGDEMVMRRIVLK